MRLFIAVPLSGEMRAALTAVQEELRRRGARGTYTREENLHLTLAFIGEYPAPDAVISAMESVPFPAVSLALDGAGSFGEVWWAGLRESEALAADVKRLRRALAEAGIPFDRKRFSPHITLLRKARGELSGVSFEPVTMTVETISLMRSDRGKHGMLYTEVGSISAL